MRKIKVLSVKTGNVPTAIEMIDTLENLQAYVGGFIEFFHLSDDDQIDLIVNEEGKINGLPINRLLFQDGEVVDAICGDLLIVCVNDDGEIVSLNDALIEKYCELFKDTVVAY